MCESKSPQSEVDTQTQLLGTSTESFSIQKHLESTLSRALDPNTGCFTMIKIIAEQVSIMGK